MKFENNDKIFLKKVGGIEKYEVKFMEMWERLGLVLVVKMGFKLYLVKLKGENVCFSKYLFFLVLIFIEIFFMFD